MKHNPDRMITRPHGTQRLFSFAMTPACAGMRAGAILAFFLVFVARTDAGVAPAMTSIFSPGSTVKLEAKGQVTALRRTTPLPNDAFTLSTGDGDLVQIQLRDGSYVRLAPFSTVKFEPMTDRITLTHGTALVFFGPNSPLRVKDMKVRGNDSVALLTNDASGNRVLPLRGSVSFHNEKVSEGHIAMADVNGAVRDIGPTNLDRFKVESPMLVDLPGSPSVSEHLAPAPVGLRATIDSLNAAARHEAREVTRDLDTAVFFGSTVADGEGGGARIAQVMKATPVTIGTPENPSATFQQIEEKHILSLPRLMPALVTVGPVVVVEPAPAPPPAPPPDGGGVVARDVVFNAGWTINGAGVINFAGDTLTPAVANGVATYNSVDSLTINANAGGVAFNDFLAAGGTELSFSTTGVKANGTSMDFTLGLDFGGLKLTLTSYSEDADISTGALTGVNALKIMSSRHLTTGAVTAGANGVDISTLNTGDISTGGINSGGAIKATSGGKATHTGALVAATAGVEVNVSAKGDISTQGVTSGGAAKLNSYGSVTDAVGLTGAAGGVTVAASGDVNLGAVNTTAAGAATVTAEGTAAGTPGDVTVGAITATGADAVVDGAVGDTAGAISVTAKRHVTLNGAVASTGGKGGQAPVADPAGVAGAGGNGGNVVIQGTEGAINGGVNVTSTGGAGGNAVPTSLGAGGDTTGAPLVTVQTAGAGGSGGDITLRAGGAGGVTVGLLTSTGGNAGTVGSDATKVAKTASGSKGGNITVEGGSSGATATGPITVTNIRSLGGTGDGGGLTRKVGVGDGGTGGDVVVRTAGNLNATDFATGIQSVGGASASHTDHSELVPIAGKSGNITVTARSINDKVLLTSVGGVGGATDGTYQNPSTTEKAGMGGDAGNVAVTITGPVQFAPQMVSAGGNAGNWQDPDIAGNPNDPLRPFSKVFNGVGGKGGDTTIALSDPAGSLNFLAAGGAKMASSGGQEISTGETSGLFGQFGGFTTKGRNISGNIEVNVGAANLTITSPTAIASAGSDYAIRYNRDGHTFETRTSGTVTLTSKDLHIKSAANDPIPVANTGGAVDAGGSKVVINSTGNVEIIGSAQGDPAFPNGKPGVHGTGSISIEKATYIFLGNDNTAFLAGGSPPAPAIWGEAPSVGNGTVGDVKISTANGAGGTIDLHSNAILASSSGRSVVTGERNLNNVTISGIAVPSLNGPLYGVNAQPLAVIASGNIDVKKSVDGSLGDVGSAGRQMGIFQDGSYTSVLRWWGAASQVGGQYPSIIIDPQQGDAKYTSVPLPMYEGDSFGNSSLPRPYDDAQGGHKPVPDPLPHISTTQLTIRDDPGKAMDPANNATDAAIVFGLPLPTSARPRLVGTDSPHTAIAAKNPDPAYDALANGALHNFVILPPDAAGNQLTPAFLSVKEAMRMGAWGNSALDLTTGTTIRDAQGNTPPTINGGVTDGASNITGDSPGGVANPSTGVPPSVVITTSTGATKIIPAAVIVSEPSKVSVKK